VDPEIYKGRPYIPHYANMGHHLEKVAQAIELGERYLGERPEDMSFRRTVQTYRIKRRLLEQRARGQQQTLVVMPPGYERGARLPVLVFLPYTGGTALSGFLKYLIERYERSIEEALGWTREHHDIDEQRFFLAGFSLGGDLSRALGVRSPDRFRGAILVGTRCGYRAGEEGLRKLKGSDFCAYFLKRAEELPARHQGMEQARELFQANGIPVLYREKAGGHVSANLQEFKKALDFLLQQRIHRRPGRLAAPDQLNTRTSAASGSRRAAGRQNSEPITRYSCPAFVSIIQ